MRAILLAAGRGTRLGEISRATPKCLQKVGGVTVLDRLVGQLMKVGVKEFLINTHHLADKVESHIDAAPWASRATVVFEKTLLGTLGTLKANHRFLDDGGWVLHADNFIAGDLKMLREAFTSRSPEVWGTMLCFRVDDGRNFGIVERAPNGIVIGFHEKVPDPPGKLASAATYLFDERVISLLTRLPPEDSDISRDLLPHLLGRLVAIETTNAVIDIGTPASLARARKLLKP